MEREGGLTMAEYIEREAVMQAFSDFVWNSNHSDLVPSPQWNHAVEIVRDIPAADVVDVVRCSDCEYYDRNDEARLDKGCYFCSCFGGYTRPTFYCAAGERKGGDE